MPGRHEREVEPELVPGLEPDRSGPVVTPSLPLAAGNQAILHARESGRELPVAPNARDPRITAAARGHATVGSGDRVVARALATAARRRTAPAADEPAPAADDTSATVAPEADTAAQPETEPPQSDPAAQPETPAPEADGPATSELAERPAAAATPEQQTTPASEGAADPTATRPDHDAAPGPEAVAATLTQEQETDPAPEAGAATPTQETDPAPEAVAPEHAAEAAAATPEQETAPETAATEHATGAEPSAADAEAAPEATDPATPSGPINALAEGGADIEEPVVDEAALAPDEPALQAAPAGPTLARSLAGDAWSKVKGAASQIASAVAKPLERLSSGLVTALPGMERRVSEVGDQAEPGAAQAAGPAEDALRSAPAEREQVLAGTVAGEQASREAAEASGAPRETGQIEVCPAEPAKDAELSILGFKEGDHGVAGELLEGAIFGDFQEDPSGWNMVGQIVLGLVPYAGQVADGRDFVAAAKRLQEGSLWNVWNWLNLALAGVGFVPVVGDLIKVLGRVGPGTVRRALKTLKSTVTDGWRGAGKAASALKQGLKRFGVRLRSGAVNVAKQAANRARRAGDALKAKVRGGVAKARSFLQGIGRKASDFAGKVKAKATDGINSAKRMIGKLTSRLPGPVRGLVDRIGTAARRAMNAARQRLQKVRATVTRVQRRLAEKARQAATRVRELADAARRRARELKNRAQTWIDARRAAVTRRVGEVVAKGKATIKKGADTVATKTKQAITNGITRVNRLIREAMRRYHHEVAQDEILDAADAWELRHGDRARELSCTRPHLESAYDQHAADFGVKGPASDQNLKAFEDAVNAHVQAPGTQAVHGQYGGQRVTHFVDATSGLVVVRDEHGQFVSGRKLSPAEAQEVQRTGTLDDR